jgi:hypothetical protein
MFSSGIERKDINHIYYNATLTNNGTIPLSAAIIDTRSDVIMQVPGDFEMSVVRFDVSALSIPITDVLVVPPANINPVSPTTLASQFMFASLIFGGITYTQNVQITPSSSTINDPLGAIYNFQKLLDDINAAYAAAYALIPGAPGGSAPPQFIWNPQTELIDLYVDDNYAYTTINPPFTLPTIQIWASYGLYLYLTGFNIFRNGFYRSDKLDIRFEVRQTSAIVQPAIGSRTGLPFSLATAPATLLLVQQEAPQSQNWNDARSLLITSSLLPIRPEYVPTNFTSSNNSVSTATQRIVSDFLIPAEGNLMSSRNVFQYLPTAEYRMIDLYGTAPFSTIDLAMSWTDYEGGLHTLLLDPGSSLSIKILFRRKGVTD